MAKKIYRSIAPIKAFSSSNYWDERYSSGGNSGAGSYGRLAVFKAEAINQFVEEHSIKTVVEFGSGDGAQLKLARYPAYTGIDVSERAIAICRTRFLGDQTKLFLVAGSSEANQSRAQLALSLDVIYHLVEDRVYEQYMTNLISAAEKFVCIYSSNCNRNAPAPHVRHRVFTDWMAANAPTWKLIMKKKNPFPEDPTQPDQTSWADLYFFRNC